MLDHNYEYLKASYSWIYCPDLMWHSNIEMIEYG
jgi:hypothetical protein